MLSCRKTKAGQVRKRWLHCGKVRELTTGGSEFVHNDGANRGSQLSECPLAQAQNFSFAWKWFPNKHKHVWISDVELGHAIFSVK